MCVDTGIASCASEVLVFPTQKDMSFHNTILKLMLERSRNQKDETRFIVIEPKKKTTVKELCL